MSVTIDGLLGISKVAEEADVVHEGDFGVGGICTANVIDFNTYPDSIGVKGHLPYVVSENGSTNGPPNGGVFFFVQHFFYINGNCVQIAWPYYSNQSMWIRKRFNEVWTPWVQQYDQQNILGTVSQSGGVPTGAIIERGENGNGEYIKFADGTMICKNVLSYTAALVALGSLYANTGLELWTFPAEFAERPVVTASDTGSVNVWFHCSAATADADLRVFSYTASITGTRYIDILAVGRWF
jgi:hypothetical protein